ncbi:HAD family phosphatase [Pseudonocardiaceae bacterium YIM PH 21723]|nr:HAD family phosphatase [Pseudonocardiaceae bacterium YIM PH 21723]
MSCPQMVVLDLDDTTVPTNGTTPSAAVRAALKRVLDAGSHLVFATGRSALGTLPVLDEIGLTGGTAFASNGAIRIDIATRELTELTTVDAAVAIPAFRELFPGAQFAAEVCGKGHLVTETFGGYGLSGEQVSCTLGDLAATTPPRLIIWWPEHSVAQMRDRIAGLELPGLGWSLDHTLPWLTVSAAGVTKAWAVEGLRRELGVPREATLAIGDGDNDVELLQWAAVGVAMGQAPEAVRQAADWVTSPFTADGVATAIDQSFTYS